MKIRKITLTDFRSFKGEHTFDLEGREQGLHFLTGRNEVEARLGANGAGKSTLLEALCWAFYGRTSRGLKAQAVRHWGSSKGCSVAVDVNLNGIACSIERTWNPNHIWLRAVGDKEELTQESLERDYLKIGFEGFTNAILFGQFDQMFFDMTPTQKLNLLSDTLGLSVWEDSAEVAKSEVKQLDSIVEAHQRELNVLQGRLVTVQDEIPGYESKASTFEEEREAAIQEETENRNFLEEKLVEIQNDLNEHEDLKKEATSQKKELQKKYEQELIKVTEAKNHHKEMEYAEKLVLSENDRLTTEYHKLMKARSKCPYCGQSISAGHFEIEKQRIKRERKEVFNKLTDARNEVHNASNYLNSVQEVASGLRADITRLDGILGEINTQLSNSGRLLDRARSSLEAANREIEKWRASDNIYEQEARRYRGTEKDLKSKIKGVEKAVKEAQAGRDAYAYWTSGFKQVRLFLIEEAIRFLEVECNNILTHLGLPEWIIKFDVERETSTGGLSKGFHLSIITPHHDEPIPWASWSGGETQRLRLAGALGLSSLILDTKGIDCNLLMIDEPSAHLDGEGMNDLLKALATYGEDLGKQIWLVDHRSYDFGGFKSQLTVIKTGEGSSIIESDSDY